MSKTFKSAWPNHPRRINIREIEDGVNVRISDPQWEDKKGITLAPSDAPALALAILEAAGFDDVDSGNTSCAVADLRTYVARVERITTEAREREQLEAEALELENAGREAAGAPLVESMSDLTASGRKVMLAVARRAREMRAEK